VVACKTGRIPSSPTGRPDRPTHPRKSGRVNFPVNRGRRVGVGEGAQAAPQWRAPSCRRKGRAVAIRVCMKQTGKTPGLQCWNHPAQQKWASGCRKFAPFISTPSRPGVTADPGWMSAFTRHGRSLLVSSSESSPSNQDKTGALLLPESAAVYPVLRVSGTRWSCLCPPPTAPRCPSPLTCACRFFWRPADRSSSGRPGVRVLCPTTTHLSRWDLPSGFCHVFLECVVGRRVRLCVGNGVG